MVEVARALDQELSALVARLGVTIACPALAYAG